jgi:hypothetical protein
VNEADTDPGVSARLRRTVDGRQRIGAIILAVVRAKDAQPDPAMRGVAGEAGNRDRLASYCRIRSPCGP